jgi:hypothetical protein
LLKIGKTLGTSSLPELLNDLPRDPATGRAFVGDERNDENLPLAQTHVALIRFHKQVVETLRATCPTDKLLETAREQVVRHFQWIVLNDYLKTVLDNEVLKEVVDEGPKYFKIDPNAELFMPLEFSAAAFRFGHSMVRPSYEWNFFHSSEQSGGPPLISQLFEQTAFSGIIGPGKNHGNPDILRLRADWIIDWRRFFDFSAFPASGSPKYPPPKGGPNHAQTIDTFINMNLESIPSFPHGNLPQDERSIAARNLIRGFALGLPTGEEVAAWIGETPLTQDEIVKGHEPALAVPSLKGKTPLWYYILKEAELNEGNRLGRVGSRIVAETLVGLIKRSRYSILDPVLWKPDIKYGRPGPRDEPVLFKMVDLLETAGVVNPIG